MCVCEGGDINFMAYQPFFCYVMIKQYQLLMVHCIQLMDTSLILVRADDLVIHVLEKWIQVDKLILLRFYKM